MAGMTINPERCERAKADLAMTIGIYPISEALFGPRLQSWKVPLVIATSLNATASLCAKYGMESYYPLSVISAVRNVWRDCDGNGGLKRHLDSAKTKIQSGVAKAKSLVPQPAPELVPIPISSYAVSAEAVARRATGPSAMAKGVVIVGAATALAAISAALSVFGFREVPMMEGAMVGLGVTTDRFSSFSDQNRPL